MICEIAGYAERMREQEKSQDGESRVWHGSNLVNLCVDACDEDRQCGKLYHMYTREPILFSSLFQAVSRMDELYDELAFPKASTELRSFLVDRKAKGYGPEEEIRVQKAERKEPKEIEPFDRMIRHRGAQATFLIRVLYRQHASWQGEVTWVDQQKTEYFRSVLELIRLLDSVLITEEKRTQNNGRLRQDE